MTGTAQVAPPPVPSTFLEYVRSFGPGIVIVLTWLGEGDVVDMATAGANYGYSLVWVFVVAVLIRFERIDFRFRVRSSLLQRGA